MGRNPIYMITLFLFVIVQIPTALANNMQTVLGLRFFAGLMAGPALSTGGATLSDMYVAFGIHLNSRTDPPLPPVTRNINSPTPLGFGLWLLFAAPSLDPPS